MIPSAVALCRGPLIGPPSGGLFCWDAAVAIRKPGPHLSLACVHPVGGWAPSESSAIGANPAVPGPGARPDGSLLPRIRVLFPLAGWRQSRQSGPLVFRSEMAGINHWSITLAGSRSCRPRWLADNGHFSSNPARALRLVTPEVAARRLQHYMTLRGWPPEVMERFRLVPSPPLPCTRHRPGVEAASAA